LIIKRLTWRWGAASVLFLVIAIGAVMVAARRGIGPIPDKATQAAEQSRTPEGMVYVPGGWFLTGTDDEDGDEDQKPLHRVYVSSFYIDRTEVTNREYRRFKADHAYQKGEDDLPVTNVTYDEAAAYAKWAGKRLPTESEWEKAARGTDGRRYPWGNLWDVSRVAARAKTASSVSQTAPTTKTPGTCLLGPSRVRRVGSVTAGISPYGSLDMAGNAWEWVQGYYRGNPNQRILRGGAVGYGERACRTYNRGIEGAGST
jgi:formylglycine-generating enzyme required for sulfatase activity